MMLALCAVAATMWCLLLCLPWQPWRIRETLSARESDTAIPQPGITALLPARNESAQIETVLRALATQAGVSAIILIDDQSDDDTAARAIALEIPHLTVIRGVLPPPGWSGKLWALQQGFERVASDLVLLLDADIELGSGIVTAMRKKIETAHCDLVSLMVWLPMQRFWEKLLLPPFVYFFKLLYPFVLANREGGRVAAAAGGCVLVKTARLRKIGGFAALRDALIDDCTLARLVKRSGGRTWIGLTHDARAIRPYRTLAEIWNMVARTAFTQLRYSRLLLMLCTMLLSESFLVPVIGLLATPPATAALAAVALLAMTLSFLPTVRYYRLAPLWVLTLPVAASLYLAMCWTSAIRYWRGERSRWKGRSYLRAESE